MGKVCRKSSQYTEFQADDPYYLKQQQHKTKLQGRWYPHYRILEKTTPITFNLKNQLDGTITKAYAEHLWLAQLDDWEIPKDKKGRPTHKVTYAAPVNSSSDQCDIENSDKEEPLTKIIKSTKNKEIPLQMKMIYP